MSVAECAHLGVRAADPLNAADTMYDGAHTTTIRQIPCFPPGGRKIRG